MVTKLYRGKKFPLPWPKIFVTGMLTRDRFAMANLLVVLATAWSTLNGCASARVTNMVNCLDDAVNALVL